MTLKENYEKAVNEYITAFVRKHDTVFRGWQGWEQMEAANFHNGYSFNFNDIRLDIDTDQPKGLIFQWHDESTHFTDLIRLPYSSYVAGARFNELN